MYSKNDYRYYLEHRLVESDDYLAHYGVKGMRWKHRKGPSIFGHKTTITTEDPTVYSNNVLVRSAQMAANRAKVAEKEKKKKKKFSLKPKNQKVTVITSPKRKRSKKEAKWNKEMQDYGKEILASQNKKRR